MSSKLNIAFQMDNINYINIKTDSTFPLIIEAINRNFDVYYYMPKSLTLKENKVLARGNKILSANYNMDNHITLDKDQILNLSNMNIIWIRQDPPFDLAYLSTTYFLDFLTYWHPRILILNHPREIRNYSEKIIAHNFTDYMPKTLITKDKELILEFLEKEKQIVLKPLFDARGNSVYLLNINDPNTYQLIDFFLCSYKEPIIVQQFIKNIYLGDKRILMIDGEPLGYFKRIPTKGIISNLAKGGKAEKTILTPKESKICKDIGKFLKQNNIFFAGVDLIDEFLTEINITSPTGIMNYLNLSSINLAINIWDKIISKYNNFVSNKVI